NCEPARLADHRLHALLVFAPEFHGYARMSGIRRLLVAHDTVHGERVADENRLDELHRHASALDEAFSKESDHHFGDVSRGHHALSQRRAKTFLSGPVGVGMDRAWTNARVAIDLPLRDRLGERRQFVAYAD